MASVGTDTQLRRPTGRLTIPDGRKDKISWSICPETCYGMSMRIMVSGFILSGIITFGFTKPDMDDDPVLNVYGAVNACITFDYDPARPIFSIIWVFVCFCQIMYVFLFTYRLRVFFKPTSKIIKASIPIAIIYVILFCSMSMVTVIQPKNSVMGHTLPYQGLILGTMIWFIWNTIIIESWPTPFRARVRNFWRGLTIVYILVSLIKLEIQWVLMIAAEKACEPHCIMTGTNTTALGEDEVFCVAECWDAEMQGKYVFPAKPLWDPIWMLIFIFYRYWHPLHSTNVVITLANDTRHNVPGDAAICCFHVVPKMHGDEGDGDGDDTDTLLPKVETGTGSA
ncbi:hypothetical protein TrCOL_g2230 [Triparma columacea]|uniref:Uncharacterized protein n=1 Tax=Triparma columacea TaxID=722753 RepID=A0A9W7G2I9_9STRA|nr:hypothetical protein TrCOL_g2230 [Triparma columacea]